MQIIRPANNGSKNRVMYQEGYRDGIEKCKEIIRNFDWEEIDELEGEILSALTSLLKEQKKP